MIFDWWWRHERDNKGLVDVPKMVESRKEWEDTMLDLDKQERELIKTYRDEIDATINYMEEEQKDHELSVEIKRTEMDELVRDYMIAKEKRKIWLDHCLKRIAELEGNN